MAVATFEQALIYIAGRQAGTRLTQLGYDVSTNLIDVTGLTSLAMEYRPGKLDTAVSLAGFYEGEGFTDGDLRSSVASDGRTVMSVRPQPGSRVAVVDAVLSQYQNTGSVNEATMVNISGQSNFFGVGDLVKERTRTVGPTVAFSLTRPEGYGIWGAVHWFATATDRTTGQVAVKLETQANPPNTSWTETGLQNVGAYDEGPHAEFMSLGTGNRFFDGAPAGAARQYRVGWVQTGVGTYDFAVVIGLAKL